MGLDRSAVAFLKMHRGEFLICSFLILSIAFVYFRVVFFDFVNVDDETYVLHNPYIKNGFSLEAIVWSFTSIYASNWHPITWLSHMLDIQVFGLRPGMHHLVNVILHMVNALLLFIFLRFSTRSITKSGMVAALFALHPLHVESVAWISERKDVLSTMFWMLTMLVYAWYTKRPSVKRYVFVAFVFTLGLMSKPMLVTLPFVLLLLDYWPLRRFGQDDSFLGIKWKIVFPLFYEKLPLIILASTSAALTFIAQKSGGAMSTLENVSVGTRLANSLTSYASYLWKMVWPVHLSIFYPLSNQPDTILAVCALLLILIITILIMFNSKKNPYLFMGWLWYIGTLVPVIGLVQVGSQSMADRYTYVPLVGLFIIAAWGLGDIYSRRWYVGRVLRIAFPLVLIFFTYLSWIQVGYWKNSFSLLCHAEAITGNNFFVNNNLGCAYLRKGDTEKAIHHYSQTIKAYPQYGLAHANLALALEMKGEYKKALEHYHMAMKCDLRSAQAHCNIGKGLYKLGGNTNDAIEELRTALALNPYLVDAWDSLGTCLVSQGKTAEGLYCYVTALRINPDYTKTWENLARVNGNQGRQDRIDN